MAAALGNDAGMSNEDHREPIEAQPPVRYPEHDQVLDLMTTLRRQLWRPMTTCEVARYLEGLRAVAVDLYESVDVIAAEGITDVTERQQAELAQRTAALSGLLEDVACHFTALIADLPATERGLMIGREAAT